jgi:hypothetical protein
MDRAFGPLEMVQIVNSLLEVRTKAPKARTISAWGNAPGREPSARSTRAEGPLYLKMYRLQATRVSAWLEMKNRIEA